MLAVLLAVVLTSCGSDSSDVPSGSRLGDAKTEATERKNKPKGVIKKAERIARRAGAAGAAGPGTSRAAGAAPDADTAGGGASVIDPSLARASARLTDPATDAEKEGVTPAYAEIIEASVTGLGENFRIVIRFNGEVPSAVPNDKTHWIVSYGMTGANEGEGYSFGAQCTTEGWQAYAGGKEGQDRFPGTFHAEGREIVMTIPWEYVMGPREFEWYAASNYFQQIANTTHYSVDLAPNKDLAKFPN
ncbi:MAG: hypothetical protein M3161_06680 [Actinomycetota bacterium]|nr:hypothetical protein [Actinomycetota bacterium]